MEHLIARAVRFEDDSEQNQKLLCRKYLKGASTNTRKHTSASRDGDQLGFGGTIERRDADVIRERLALIGCSKNSGT
ncbi:hypothetical protein O3P69_020852 [Scylla paramamosain]|uniref:Uncharacterized protein n=1 Tax=Scylla paramamosain TaxID=85552 RepID=A0AAW0TNS5_SCYPA